MRSAKAAFAALLIASVFAAGCNRPAQGKPDSVSREAIGAAADSNAAPGKKSAPGSLLGTDSVPDVLTLLDTVEARLRRGDTVGLVKLMLDDSAYRRHIFPTSQAYDPSSEEAFKFVLGMHKANSAKGLRRVLNSVQRPDSVKAVILRSLDSVSVPGGMIYQVRQGEGVRPFGTALKTGTACRIATFAGQ